jgi:hypothetical protein
MHAVALRISLGVLWASCRPGGVLFCWLLRLGKVIEIPARVAIPSALLVVLAARATSAAAETEVPIGAARTNAAPDQA